MTQGSAAAPAAEARGTCNDGPLAGVRVLDLTSVLFGPYACQWLGDFGADVIKVEGPGGDNARHFEPMRSPGMGTTFLGANRNKRSIGLDLKTPAGLATLMRLTATADVLVHNIRPDAAARLGIDYAHMRAAKSDLIYASANGFGRSGPYAGRPAYDDIIQSASGLADLASQIPPAAGQTGRPPIYTPASIADKISGLTLLAAVLAALYHRARTGEGQELEVPMFETMVAFNLVEHFTGGMLDPVNGKIGYPRLLSPDRRPYRTKDGWITVLPYSDKHWRAFFTAAGRPDLLDDPRVNDTRMRSREVGTLYAILTDVMPTRTTAEWLRLMAEADVPATRVNSLEELMVDPHLSSVGFFKDVEHPSEGRIRQPDVPVRFSASTPDALRLPAPRLGEQTRQILAEIGLSVSEIDSLIQSGAAFDVSGAEPPPAPGTTNSGKGSST